MLVAMICKSSVLAVAALVRFNFADHKNETCAWALLATLLFVLPHHGASAQGGAPGFPQRRVADCTKKERLRHPRAPVKRTGKSL
ncbi:MAG: hypothetical protein ACRD41_16720 [Candidatus Acidiferrales bacterium]